MHDLYIAFGQEINVQSRGYLFAADSKYGSIFIRFYAASSRKSYIRSMVYF